MPKKVVRDRTVNKSNNTKTVVTNVVDAEGKQKLDVTDTVVTSNVDKLQDTPNVAKIRVGGSVTKNMGNFNSVRVSIEIEMPCLPTKKDIDATYVSLSEEVEDMVTEELDIANERF